MRRGIELEIELKREKDGIEYLHGWIDATEREVRLRDEEVARLAAVNRELLESTSYKAGQAITAVPRAIKDAFSKKDGQ